MQGSIYGSDPTSFVKTAASYDKMVLQKTIPTAQ
jgi:hypothetical protein